jgi:hypothetical protein
MMNKHRDSFILAYELWKVIVFCVGVASTSILGLLIYLFSYLCYKEHSQRGSNKPDSHPAVTLLEL